MKYNSFSIQSAVEVVGNPEPVSLDDAKVFLRISNTTEDPLLYSLILAARKSLEKLTGVYFKPYTVTAIVQNQLGMYNFFTPMEAGATLTWNDPPTGAVSSDLVVKGTTERQITDATDSTLSLTAVVGYGTTNFPCPEDVKTAILNEVASMYYNRGDSNKGDWYSQRARTLIASYRKIII